MRIHIVKKGDTLNALAQKYNVELEKLLELNPQITDPDEIEPGMKIKIPSAPKPVQPSEDGAMHKHVVQQGDTLWELSKKWGVPLQSIVQANPQLKNPNVLMTGDVVYIPQAGAPAPHAQQSGQSASQETGDATQGGMPALPYTNHNATNSFMQYQVPAQEAGEQYMLPNTPTVPSIGEAGQYLPQADWMQQADGPEYPAMPNQEQTANPMHMPSVQAAEANMPMYTQQATYMPNMPSMQAAEANMPMYTQQATYMPNMPSMQAAEANMPMYTQQATYMPNMPAPYGEMAGVNYPAQVSGNPVQQLPPDYLTTPYTSYMSPYAALPYSPQVNWPYDQTQPVQFTYPQVEHYPDISPHINALPGKEDCDCYKHERDDDREPKAKISQKESETKTAVRSKTTKSKTRKTGPKASISLLTGKKKPSKRTSRYI